MTREELETANRLATENTSLRAEVEQLKVLLQEAVSDPRRNVIGDDWWRRAKAALEDKP